MGRKIYVTDFVKEVAQAAEAILSQVNAINHQSLAYKGQLYGKLKISVVSTGKYVLPYFLMLLKYDYLIQLENKTDPPLALSLSCRYCRR